MKLLLMHCKKCKTKVTGPATRPENIVNEEMRNPIVECNDCVVALVTVEEADSIEVVQFMTQDIQKMAADIGRKSVVILPFAHLSNRLATHSGSVPILDQLQRELETNFEVLRSHFGSHKELLLDVYGHPGNVRFREYNQSNI